MNEHTTMHVARDAASLSRPIGSTVYDSARVRGVCGSLAVQDTDGSPLEVFSDEADHTPHVALKDTLGADLRCDDLSNDGVERSRSAACKQNVLAQFRKVSPGVTYKPLQ